MAGEESRLRVNTMTDLSPLLEERPKPGVPKKLPRQLNLVHVGIASLCVLTLTLELVLVVVGDQALVDGIRYAVMSLAGLTFLSSLYLVPLHPVHFLLTAAGAVWTTAHVLWAAGVVSGGVPAAFLADDRLWLHWLAFGVAAVGLVSQLVHWWSVLQRRRLHRQLLPLQTPPHDCWATISYTEFGRHVPHDRPLFLHVRHPYTSASVGSMKHAFSQPNHLALAGMPAVRYPAVFDPALDRGVDLSDEVQRRRAAIEAVHFTLYLDPTTGNVNLHLHKDSFKCTTFVGVEDPERFSGTDYVGPDLSQLRDSDLEFHAGEASRAAPIALPRAHTDVGRSHCILDMARVRRAANELISRGIDPRGELDRLSHRIVCFADPIQPDGRVTARGQVAVRITFHNVPRLIDDLPRVRSMSTLEPSTPDARHNHSVETPSSEIKSLKKKARAREAKLTRQLEEAAERETLITATCNDLTDRLEKLSLKQERYKADRRELRRDRDSVKQQFQHLLRFLEERTLAHSGGVTVDDLMEFMQGEGVPEAAMTPAESPVPELAEPELASMTLPDLEELSLPSVVVDEGESMDERTATPTPQQELAQGEAVSPNSGRKFKLPPGAVSPFGQSLGVSDQLLKTRALSLQSSDGEPLPEDLQPKKRAPPVAPREAPKSAAASAAPRESRAKGGKKAGPKTKAKKKRG